MVVKLADMGALGELAGTQRQQDGPAAGKVAAESFGGGVVLDQVLARSTGIMNSAPNRPFTPTRSCMRVTNSASGRW